MSQPIRPPNPVARPWLGDNLGGVLAGSIERCRKVISRFFRSGRARTRGETFWIFVLSRGLILIEMTSKGGLGWNYPRAGTSLTPVNGQSPDPNP